ELPGRDIGLLERLTMKFAIRASRSVTGAAPLLKPLLERSVVDPEKHMPPRLLARYLAPFVGTDGVAHLYVLARALRRLELEEIALEEIQAPTLVIRSQFDEWLDDAVAERLAEAIPGGRLIRVPSAGRLLPEEQPEALAQLIHDFDTADDDESPTDEGGPVPNETKMRNSGSASTV